MAGERSAIQVDGLQDLRRAFSGVDKESLKAVQATTKRAAQIVATEAGRNAPRGTRPIPKGRTPHKRLADGYTATTSGSKGIVRNKLPHAAIYEFRKTGSFAQMRGVRPVERAIESKTDEVLQELASGLDAVISGNGFT